MGSSWSIRSAVIILARPRYWAVMKATSAISCSESRPERDGVVVVGDLAVTRHVGDEGEHGALRRGEGTGVVAPLEGRDLLVGYSNVTGDRDVLVPFVALVESPYLQDCQLSERRS
jgi:hypothetical protein